MNFDLLPVKLIIFTILLWPISRVWLRFKDNSVKFGTFLFWTALWIAGVFAIFFPGFLSFVAGVLGIGRGSDMVMYFALIVAFYLIFRLSVALENLRSDVAQLIREIALLNKKGK
ncbi:DUF2304 domain-containing protein [Candidatus Beckwithbacteria bacterium]|nr:DUF2304 domain-containing protein [Candidatus Beckwithbacteria bacterium]